MKQMHSWRVNTYSQHQLCFMFQQKLNLWIQMELTSRCCFTDLVLQQFPKSTNWDSAPISQQKGAMLKKKLWSSFHKHLQFCCMNLKYPGSKLESGIKWRLQQKLGSCSDTLYASEVLLDVCLFSSDTTFELRPTLLKSSTQAS